MGVKCIMPCSMNDAACNNRGQGLDLCCPGGRGVLPYMGYIGMRGPKGCGFSAVLVINRVSNLADSGHN